jgi:hypothetical protein
MKHRWTAAALAVSLLAKTAAAQSCPGDLDGNGTVTVDEILTVVNAALNGCQPSPTPTVPPATATPTRTATPSRTATATPRFIDNGNGTVTDTTTRLMWEKKTDDGGIHDKDQIYSWSLSGQTQPNGDMFTSFIPTLNAARFGGHNDWRVPTLEELETIVSTGGTLPGRPVVPPVFDTNCVPGCNITQCSCTRPINYWTVSVNPADNRQAWHVLFNTGQSGVGFKTLQFAARAVRAAD